MANRFTRRVLTAIAVAGAMGATLAVLPSIAGALPHQSPATPAKTPTIAQAQQQLGTLALKNAQLIEDYDQARIAVHKRREAATVAQQAASAAQHKLAMARAQLTDSITAMYETGSFSSTGALLTSDSGSSYLDRLDTMSLIDDHNAQIVVEVKVVKKQAADARNHANALLSEARTELAALGQKRDEVQAEVEKQKKLLSQLTAAQAAAAFAAQGGGTSSASAGQIGSATQKLATGKGPAAARKAAQWAVNQVGKPYSFGSAGPSTFDCSGLTMMAYRSVGISLPHSALHQYDYGQHVSFSQLQPGDLIFLYSPISHVEIYIGDGLAVSAPTTGENVKVIQVSSGGDYAGATRLVH